MSSTNESRKFTTEERLRQAYIETLEILQRTQDENQELRKEISLHRKGLKIEEEVSLILQEPNIGHSNSNDNILQGQSEQIKQITEELLSVKAELKTLKYTSSAAIFEGTKELKQTQERILHLENEMSISQKLLICKETIIKNLQEESLKNNTNPVDSKNSDTKFLEYEEELRQKNFLLEELVTKTKNLSSQLSQQTKTSEFLKAENLNMQKALEQGQSDLLVLRGELGELQQLLAKAVQSKTVSSSLQAVDSSIDMDDSLVGERSDSLNEGDRAALKKELGREDFCSYDQVQAEEQHRLIYAVRKEIGFAEYIQLKKENKALKLQVALLKDEFQKIEHDRKSRRRGSFMSATTPVTADATKLIDIDAHRKQGVVLKPKR